jgi:hypothetical protein
MQSRGHRSTSWGVCFEMPENEEKATAVYAKKVHKGAFDEVNRVISKQTLATRRGQQQQPRWKDPVQQRYHALACSPGAWI